MKLITFAVPCYNSQSYMKTCIDSLLIGGEDVEILIINDGSSDQTGSIAEEYQSAYPTIVRAVHQENGGHGAGVNKGLQLANGLYYKVVDSDDCLDPAALYALLKVLKQHLSAGISVDLYITNFVYNHTEDQTNYVCHFRKQFPSAEIIGWENVKPMYLWHMLLMHALVYRTELLRKAGTLLPEHTCYVDNLFAYQPLPYVKKLFYLDRDLYLYSIGRADQSVSIQNMVERYAQQIKVMSLMLSSHSYEQIHRQIRPLQKQMYHFLHSVMLNTYFFTTQKDEPERRSRLNRLWKDLQVRDPRLYHKMRRMPLILFVNCLSWKWKGRVSLWSYRILARHVKLGA